MPKLNYSYIAGKLRDAITFGEIERVKNLVKIGDRFPVAVIDEFVTGTRDRRVRVGRVVSKHNRCVMLDTGTSISYVDICIYFRRKAEDPSGKHYI